MRSYFKLAWRNLWRNKRRTLITMASILFALFFALVMRSMQIGTYKRMIDNLVQVYTGYIQLHQPGYWEDKDINKSFTISDSLLESLIEIPNVKDAVPRLEYFALASSGQQTKGVAVIGIDPVREDKFTRVSKWITSGNYLEPSDQGVLVAKRLADFLAVEPGDTLVLLGQGYHGISVAGKFPVTGILNFPSPDMNSQMVYMNLPLSCEFFGTESRITSLSLNLKDPDRINETVALLRAHSSYRHLAIMTWEEILVELVQYIKADNASGLIFLMILYLVIAFGVFGTVVMMTAERKKEFGVMIALGMQKYRLAFVTILEMIIIGILGILSGVLLSIPILAWYYHHPIPLTGEYASIVEIYGMEPVMCFAFQPDFFIAQSLVVMGIVLAATMYPFITILRMNVIRSIRSKI